MKAKIFSNRLKFPLLLLMPIALGYLIKFSMVLPKAGVVLLVLSPFILLPYWFWVGHEMASVCDNYFAAIVLGNSLNLFSALLYISQFVFMEPGSRNIIIDEITQMYVLPLTVISGKVSPVLMNATAPTNRSLESIVGIEMFQTWMLVVVYSVGYCYARKCIHRNKNFARLIGENFAK